MDIYGYPPINCPILLPTVIVRGSCSHTEVVLLVGQSKLFLSALLSKVVLDSQPNRTPLGTASGRFLGGGQVGVFGHLPKYWVKEEEVFQQTQSGELV